MDRHLAPLPNTGSTGDWLFERTFLLKQPLPDGRDAVEDLLSDNAVRWRLSQGAISLTGAKAHATLTSVFKLGDVTLEKRRA
jgi:hypothetical protein